MDRIVMPLRLLNLDRDTPLLAQDRLRCQVSARQVALVCNWWSLFVRSGVLSDRVKR